MIATLERRKRGYYKSRADAMAVGDVVTVQTEHERKGYVQAFWRAGFDCKTQSVYDDRDCLAGITVEKGQPNGKPQRRRVGNAPDERPD